MFDGCFLEASKQTLSRPTKTRWEPPATHSSPSIVKLDAINQRLSTSSICSGLCLLHLEPLGITLHSAGCVVSMFRARCRISTIKIHSLGHLRAMFLESTTLQQKALQKTCFNDGLLIVYVF